MSEKQVLKKLQSLFGVDAVFLTKANAFGDRTKYAYGFLIDKIAKHFGAIDTAPAGYRNKYDMDIGQLLEDVINQNQLRAVDIHVGSWVHGWIHLCVFSDSK